MRLRESQYLSPLFADLYARQSDWVGAGAAVVTDKQETPSACSLSVCTAWPRQPGGLSEPWLWACARLSAMMWTAALGCLSCPPAAASGQHAETETVNPAGPKVAHTRAWRTAPCTLSSGTFVPAYVWRPAVTRRNDGSNVPSTAVLMICRGHIWLNIQNKLSDGDAATCHRGTTWGKNNSLL